MFTDFQVAPTTSRGAFRHLNATVAKNRLRTHMCCCCPNIHRHQIHLISYGCVSFFLISTGLVFTVFAIFQKDSQIGKVWLAGPTTMVVGLVLCGKVIIDWGPAMMHAREGSIDSRLMDHMNRNMPRMSDIPMRSTVVNNFKYEHEPKCNGSSKPPFTSPSPHLTNSLPRQMPYAGTLPRTREYDAYQDAQSCLIYSQYDSPLNNINGFPSLNRSMGSPIQNSRHSSTTTANSPNSSAELCECSRYGTMRRLGGTPFQGESFVLNERSYLI